MKLHKTILIIISVFIIIFVNACGNNADIPEAEPSVQPSPESYPHTEEIPSIPEPESIPDDNEVNETRTEEEVNNEPEIEEEPVDPVTELIANMINAMTLYEKICQMLIVTLDSLTGVSGATIAGERTKAALETYPVGGIIHFSPNIINSEQILLLNEGLQELSDIPLFIAVDEEGGSVARLRQKLRAHSVRAMLSYEDGGTEKAFENAVIISDALLEHGFNTNFAPVADVWSNPANTVIGNRAFSKEFDSAADLVAAAVTGFRESNIICSIKHFPGHGSTRGDSHHTSAYINKTLNELRENEFLPFISGIDAGTDMVMTGHLIVPEIDELPATLSGILITDILRGELGFNGVVITDSLAMRAITGHFDVKFVAVTAITAGVDILLMPSDIDETITALIEAVENDEISEQRINESVERILKLKIHG